MAALPATPPEEAAATAAIAPPARVRRERTAPVAPAAESSTLFLGLNLILLAFFVLLVAISEREERRTRLVIESLHATFATRPTVPAWLPATDGGELALAGDPLDRLARVLRADLPLHARIEHVAGERIEWREPVAAWFAPGEAEPLAERRVLLGRIALALAGSGPEPLAAEITLTVADLARPGASGPARARLEALALRLVLQGAPRDRLVLGLEERASAELRIAVRPAAGIPPPEATHAR